MDSLNLVTKMMLAKYLKDNQITVFGLLSKHDYEFLTKHPKMLIHAYIWSKFKEEQK